MPSEFVDQEEIKILLKAQEGALCQLARGCELTSDVKAKTAKLIMHLGREKLRVGKRLDAEEIATEALFLLLAMNMPKHGIIYPH